MGDVNALEGHAVILVDGEILGMPKPSPAHNCSTGLAHYLFADLFHPGYYVRVRTCLPLTLDTDPVPDLAVVTGVPRDYCKRHPHTAALVVEVSDWSISYDTNEKSHIYAAAGIADCWVIDVNTPQLFVFRDPVADASAPRGFRYNTTLTLARGQSVVPLAAPHAFVQVNDLLP